MAEVPEQKPQTSAEAHSQHIREHGPEGGIDGKLAAKSETETIELIQSMTNKFKSNPTRPTFQEVQDLFAKFQPKSHFDFTAKNPNVAREYYNLADIIIDKWNTEEMTDDEAFWIANHLNLYLRDNQTFGKYADLFKDGLFKRQIIESIRKRWSNPTYQLRFRNFLENIQLLPVSVPAAAAAAAPAAPAAPAVDPLSILMATIEDHKDNMNSGEYVAAMNAIRSLYQRRGGYRQRTKHSKKSKKHSKKSRKTKSRRH